MVVHLDEIWYADAVFSADDDEWVKIEIVYTKQNDIFLECRWPQWAAVHVQLDERKLCRLCVVGRSFFHVKVQWWIRLARWCTLRAILATCFVKPKRLSIVTPRSPLLVTQVEEQIREHKQQAYFRAYEIIKILEMMHRLLNVYPSHKAYKCVHCTYRAAKNSHIIIPRFDRWATLRQIQIII